MTTTSIGSPAGFLPLQRGMLCLVEARPSVQFNFLLRFLTGASLSSAVAGEGELGRTAWAALTWTLAVVAVYLYNGVMDVCEDRLNGSRRPIARGELPPTVATAVAAGVAVASVAGSVMLGPAHMGMIVFLLALGYLYSGPPFHLKRRTSGTIAIGMTASVLSYVAGAYAYAGELQNWPPLIVFVLAASLWTGLVGTATKDLPDMEGDAAAGRVTFAVMHGEGALRLAIIGVSITLPAVVTSVVVLMDLSLGLPAAAMCAGGMAIALLCSASIPPGPRRRQPYALFMITQYVLHACVIVPQLLRDWPLG
ncbi:UbiA family prenyltransferase [Nonomuraea rhizosphaerae]|uniref:UbiA family prenyltransferase n=1 Tax=Nonomuraea rhizosphaerae TaxID=2665663 RepID=UPI001C607846|nr:UbiA family prenyltransferase [Nonomuraea rhizosphaerae]